MPQENEPVEFIYVVLTGDDVMTKDAAGIAELLKTQHYTSDTIVQGVYAYKLNSTRADLFPVELVTEYTHTDEMDWMHYRTRFILAGRQVEVYGWTIDGRS